MNSFQLRLINGNIKIIIGLSAVAIAGKDDEQGNVKREERFFLHIALYFFGILNIREDKYFFLL